MGSFDGRFRPTKVAVDRKPSGLVRLISAPLFFTACGKPAASPTAVATSTETIHLVALGDSTPAAYGVVRSYVDMYADYMRQDLGVQVEVHNWARNGLGASEVWDALRGDGRLRADVRRADVITIWAGFNDIYPAIGVDPGGATCGPWTDLDLECVSRRVAGLCGSIDGIVEELLSLVDPQEALILFADVGNPLSARWAAAGLLETLKGPVMEAWIDHVSEACEGTGIHVVHTYRALNGPRGVDEVDPALAQEDGLHLSAKGHELLAELHREVGCGGLTLSLRG
jgi:lysophospholipase L1-like esterase